MGVQLPPLAPPLPAQVAACSVRQYPVAMADRPDLSALKIDEHARRGPQRHGRRVLVILTVGLLALGGTGYALLREQVPEVQTAIVRADKGGRPASPSTASRRGSCWPGSRSARPTRGSRWPSRTSTTASCGRPLPASWSPRTPSAGRWCPPSPRAAASRARASPPSWT